MKHMKRRAAALILALAMLLGLAACGKDGKQGGAKIACRKLPQDKAVDPGFLYPEPGQDIVMVSAASRIAELLYGQYGHCHA